MKCVCLSVCGCTWVCVRECILNIMREYCYLLMVFIFAEECSYWLPLYGSMCCRLAAQPHCMTQQMMSGCLKVKVSWQVGVQHWCVDMYVIHTHPPTHTPYFLQRHLSLCVLLCLLLITHSIFFVYLAAVWRWPSELDESVRRSERNEPFLLPPARRCGGQRWTSFHYCDQQGQEKTHIKTDKLSGM